MKKVIIASLLVFCAALLALSSCKNDGKEKETEQVKADWRNSIEYEGSFYVSPEIKLLYALDKGTITLWDNKGDGKILQTLKYDSTASDAIERLDNSDANGDGMNDIMVIFSESAGESKYNLWLWNTESANYTYCSLFRQVINPEIDAGTKTVTETRDHGAFGKVKKVYKFTDANELELQSSEILELVSIAGKIAGDIFPGAEITLGDGKATFFDAEHSVYVAKNAGEQVGYLAYSEDSDWYVDTGCSGAYRIVANDGSAFTAGVYIEDGGKAVEILAELSSANQKAVTISEKRKGKLAESEATSYTMDINGVPTAVLYIDESGIWYYRGINEYDVYFLTTAGTTALGEVSGKRFSY